MNLHSVLLQIATQSLTIGECNYFGSHNIVTLGTTQSCLEPMSGACMLMHGPACPCMCLQAPVHSCSAGGHFFLELHPYDCNL